MAIRPKIFTSIDWQQEYVQWKPHRYCSFYDEMWPVGLENQGLAPKVSVNSISGTHRNLNVSKHSRQI